MGKGLNKMLEIIGVSKEDDEDFDNTFEDDEEEDIEEEGITVTQNRYPRSGGSQRPVGKFAVCQKGKQKGGYKHEHSGLMLRRTILLKRAGNVPGYLPYREA